MLKDDETGVEKELKQKHLQKLLKKDQLITSLQEKHLRKVTEKSQKIVELMEIHKQEELTKFQEKMDLLKTIYLMDLKQAQDLPKIEELNRYRELTYKTENELHEKSMKEADKHKLLKIQQIAKDIENLKAYHETSKKMVKNHQELDLDDLKRSYSLELLDKDNELIELKKKYLEDVFAKDHEIWLLKREHLLSISVKCQEIKELKKKTIK
jgi:hypothetical protein